MSKEWKGNSRSAQYALAINKKDSTEERETDDFYATDPVALEKLLDNASRWLKFHFIYRQYREIPMSVFDVWEPACGNGNLATVLDIRGYSYMATDLKERGCKLHNYASGIDFLKHNGRNFNDKYIAHIILTNPPYSLANEFIEHALEILPDGGLYIALMNISVLARINRYERIYSKRTLREVYVFSKRIGCWKNNVRDDKKAHIINYAWFIFQKGFNGQPTLYWL